VSDHFTRKPPTPPALHDDERVFFTSSNGAVRVTSLRLTVRGHDYPMAGVTGARVETERTAAAVCYTVGGICTAITVGLCLVRTENILAAACPLLLAAMSLVIGLLYARPSLLLLDGPGGPRKALASLDHDTVGKAARAVNEAVIARG
jgi:hypothetical protein